MKPFRGCTYSDDEVTGGQREGVASLVHMPSSALALLLSPLGKESSCTSGD